MNSTGLCFMYFVPQTQKQILLDRKCADVGLTKVTQGPLIMDRCGSGERHLCH